MMQCRGLQEALGPTISMSVQRDKSERQSTSVTAAAVCFNSILLLGRVARCAYVGIQLATHVGVTPNQPLNGFEHFRLNLQSIIAAHKCTSQGPVSQASFLRTTLAGHCHSLAQGAAFRNLSIRIGHAYLSSTRQLAMAV